jgi:hypothetical protein
MGRLTLHSFKTPQDHARYPAKLEAGQAAPSREMRRFMSKTGGLGGEAAQFGWLIVRRKIAGRWRHPNRCRLNCNGSNTSGQAACAALPPSYRL